MTSDPARARYLDGAVRQTIDAFRYRPVPGPALDVHLRELCTLLQERIALGPGVGLDTVLAHARTVLARLPSGPASGTGDLADLGDALRRSALANGEEVPLGEYLAFARTALARSFPGDPHRESHLVNLAALLFVRWTVDGNREGLGEALVLRRTVVHESPGEPGLPERLNPLGAVARRWYDITSDARALDEAVAAHRQGVRSTPPVDRWHRTHLGGLCDALRLRYEEKGDLGVLREAVAVGLAAVRLCPAGDPGRPELLDLAALALWDRYGAEGEVATLNMAATLSREAVATATDPVDLRAYRSNLCGILNDFQPVTADRALVEEAVGVGRLATADGGGSAHAWSNLATALTDGYRRTGDLAFLDEAIATDRRVLQLAPPGHRSRPLFLYRLANHLQVRYIATGNPVHRDEAFDTIKVAAALAPPGTPIARTCGLALGEALLQRARSTLDGDAAREAVDVFRRLITHCPPGDPNRALYLVDLAASLWAAYAQAKDASLLDEGIAAGTEALVAASLGPVMRTYAELNLGVLLLHRYENASDPGDLDRAAVLTGRVAAAIGPGLPNHALALSNHASVLDARYRRDRDPAAAEAVVEAYQRVIVAGPGEVAVRVDAARHLAELAAGRQDWPVAAEAGRAGIALLPRLAPRHYRHEHKEQVLARFPGLAGVATAAAVHVGPPEQAVELLEQGRGLLLADALDVRGELAALRARAPELAERLDRLRLRLDSAAQAAVPGAPLTAGGQRDGAVHPEEDLGAVWDRLIAEVRARPGFDRFLLPPSAAELRDVGAEGPVVAVNLSPYHCDAFVVAATGTRVVPLPGLTAAAVDQRAAAFGEALATGQDEAAGPVRRMRAEDTVRETLGWLWDVLAEPILAALDLTGAGAGELPRVWWMPTGALNFLPVHAAGHYPPPGAGPAGPDDRNLLDRAVSSYAPTLRGLLRARRAPSGAGAARHQPLVVAVPGPAGAPHLRNVRAEADEIASRYPGGRSLVGRAAGRDQVLASLPGAGWVHFACHGYSDVADPSRGHLALHESELSVREVTGLDLSHAEFALLSACATARGGTALPDESIHLTAAFHLAGYRHVVGTLWPVADDVARAVTRGLYGTLGPDRRPGGRAQFAAAARALHRTVQDQRRRWPGTPSLWTSWIHIGA
jgi:hypothetical protein